MVVNLGEQWTANHQKVSSHFELWTVFHTRPSSGILFDSLTGVSPQNRGASDSDLGVPIIFSGSMFVSFQGGSFQKPWLQIDRNTPWPLESPSKIDYRILEVGRVSSPNVSKYSNLTWDVLKVTTQNAIVERDAYDQISCQNLMVHECILGDHPGIYLINCKP